MVQERGGGNTGLLLLLGLGLAGGGLLLYRAYQEGKIIIEPGPTGAPGALSVAFTWRNNNPEIAIAPQWRLDLKRKPSISTPWLGWNEGEWVQSEEVLPGEISEEIVVSSIGVPGDWRGSGGSDISVKLVVTVPGALGTTTVWERDRAAHIG